MRIRVFGSPPDGDAHVCTCGHLADGHRHYRSGTDCSVPGCSCPRYEGRDSPIVRARTLGKRLRGWLTRASVVGWGPPGGAPTPRADQA